MPTRRKTREMKVDFYQVVMPSRSSSFEKVLQQISQLPNNRERNRTIGKGPIRMNIIKGWDLRHEGDMVRIRMDEIPPRAKLSGELKPLNLAEDEGLGEETAFCFDPSVEIVAMQRNRVGVTPQQLALYCSEMARLQEPIQLLPVLKADAYTRVQGMAGHSKLIVRAAGLKNMDAFGSALGLKELGKVSKELESPFVEITFSIGRKRSRLLAKKGIMKFLGNLMNIESNTDNDALEKLTVVGRDKEGESTYPIDLLDFALGSVQRVTIEGKRQVPYRQRQQAIRDALLSCSSELTELFAEP